MPFIAYGGARPTHMTIDHGPTNVGAMVKTDLSVLSLVVLLPPGVRRLLDRGVVGVLGRQHVANTSEVPKTYKNIIRQQPQDNKFWEKF